LTKAVQEDTEGVRNRSREARTSKKEVGILREYLVGSWFYLAMTCDYVDIPFFSLGVFGLEIIDW
jgi:hypothetical protein